RLARGAAVIRDEGHRRAAGARPRGEGLPHPALEDARADPPAVLCLAGAELGVPGDVRAVRELSVELDLGPDGGEVERRELLDGGDSSSTPSADTPKLRAHSLPMRAGVSSNGSSSRSMIR